jgi:uncharacterized membrane protein
LDQVISLRRLATTQSKVFAATNLTTFAAILTVVSLALRNFPLAQLCSIVGLIVLPGLFWARAMMSNLQSTTVRIVVVAAIGFFNFICVGAFVGFALPKFGVDHPLRGVVIEIVWIGQLLLIAWKSHHSGADPFRIAVKDISGRNLRWIALLSIPPLVALLGSAILNKNGNSILAVTAALLAVGMAVTAISLPTAKRGPPRIALLASSLLTAAWQLPFRGGWLAGWDVQHEWSVGSVGISHSSFPLPTGVGGITDPYRGMLSLTVWPAQIHALTGLNLRTILALAPSIFLVLCLLAVWCTVRTRVSERWSATICAIFIVGSEPLIRELPSVTRQCYALFFFGVLLFAVTSPLLKATTARKLSIIAGAGIAVTHYSTAYLAAAAIAMGWIASVIYRVPKAQRVLSASVSLVIVGFIIAWGSLIARTGSSLSQVWASIKRDGFRFLPSSGSFITKWLSGASVSQTVSGKALHLADLNLRRTQYSWMNVDPRAIDQSVLNSHVPTSSGWGSIGVGLKFLEIIASEATIIIASISVIFLILLTRRNRSLAPITGIALFAVATSFVSRLSQTIAVDFGPTRIQAQMFLVFAVTIAIGLSSRPRPTRARLHGKFYGVLRRIEVPSLAIICILVLLTSTQLTNLLVPKASLPAALVSTGEQIQRIVKPTDIAAARWIALTPHRSQTIQSDIFGQLALFDFGLSSSNHVIPNIDPVIVDDRAWVFVSQTNLQLQIARGGDNARIGIFQFPLTFFERTRNILYSSSTDAVLGSDPIYLLQATGVPSR